MAVSMLVQTLYLLADLFWVGRLGKEAIAAVGVAGNLMMVVLALTQMLGVGTTTLISHAAGKKDQPEAELVFNQSWIMSILVAVALGCFGFLLRDAYCNSISADAATAALAKSYLLWFLPALLLQFPLVALGSALRANGIIKPTVGLQVLSVVINMVLAPLLIFGVGPFPRMGVTGAALASFVAILIADILMIVYFEKKYHYLRFRFSLMRPQIKIWAKMLRIGVPAGTEFILLFFYIMVVYAIIRNFGPAAQAGFGVGARVMQALISTGRGVELRGLSGDWAKFGGRRADRVRQTVYSAIGIAAAMMLVLTLVAYMWPAPMLSAIFQRRERDCFWRRLFADRRVQFRRRGYRLYQLQHLPGIVNTWPPLLSSLTRLFIFIIPAVLLSRMPGFQIKHVWYLSVASQVTQACVNLLLLRRELRRKLVFDRTEGFAPASATAS